jgi:hypothetical protein
VADACNPSYSGSRNQEDRGSKPALTNSSQDPISKKIHHKKRAGVAQGVGPEFKPLYHENKQTKNKVERLTFTSNLVQSYSHQDTVHVDQWNKIQIPETHLHFENSMEVPQKIRSRTTT